MTLDWVLLAFALRLVLFAAWTCAALAAWDRRTLHGVAPIRFSPSCQRSAMS